MSYIPAQITSAGLTVAPLTGTSEAGLTGILDYLQAQFTAIYQNEIDFSSNTPDGQALNIFAQIISDVLQFLVMINAGIDPDQAFGIILRLRVGINGIQANDGTYSTVEETIVVSGPCTLPGLDQVALPVYTISDQQGNNWQLVNTVSFTIGGTYTETFQAQNPGAVTAPADTIQTPVTTILAIESVNNAAAAVPGQTEEQDAALKLRRQQSVAIGSIGQTQGMKAALLNLSGIVYANVYENDTGATDGNGVPGHSIWVVVSPGSVTNEAIANAIYIKRGQGCGIYYSADGTTYAVTQPDGSIFIVGWDELSPENMYVEFEVTGITAQTLPNVSGILAGLPQSFPPGTAVNINGIGTLIQAIDPNTLVTGCGLCLTSGGTYTSTLSPSMVDEFLQITDETIIMTYTGEQDLSSFGGSATSVQEIVANPYNPSTTEPVPVSVAHSGTLLITLYGGFTAGGYTYSFIVNNSGGSFAFTGAGANTGHYTAGSTIGVYDIIKFQDTMGNTGYILLQTT